MDLIVSILENIWFMWVSMAPYLILGFLLAGMLHAFIKPEWMKKQLGKPGWLQSVKATFIGVPMPLCSCAVIPVAAGIHKQGASRGATTAFLASTPQTGVDSIAATLGLMGPVFAIIRIVVAFISGILVGLLVGLTEKNIVSTNDFRTSTDSCKKNSLRSGLFFAFVTLPRDIAKAVILGIIIAGVTTALIPESFFLEYFQNTWINYLIITIASVPLYVCSTGSIPLALALLNAGLSPGTALILLIAGPATNAATISTLWSLMGARVVAIYTSTIIFVSWTAGALLDYYHSSTQFRLQIMPDHDSHLNWIDHLFGALLVILFLNIFIKSISKTSGETLDKNKSIKISAKNMTCEHCAENVKTALLKLHEVHSVEVNLDSSDVYAQGNNLNPSKLEKTLRDAGY